MLKFITLSILLFSALTLNAQRSGAIFKVVDENNLNLPGASIRLEPGHYTDITDQQGLAYINGLPAGDYTVTVTYVGYKDHSNTITVAAGSTGEYEIRLSEHALLGDEVVVIGDRLAGQAKALSQQKTNDNISNIVSADQIGRFPDGNIGDAVKRIPGITMQNDQGEARNIIIRGMGPEFNSVSLNGERIPSAEGDNRRVQMDLIPADMIQTIQVNKTVTADMDADAIGGSVNLLTRTAPNALRISGTVAAGYNPIRKDGLIYNGQLFAGSRLAGGRFGWGIGASLNQNTFGSDNIEAVWEKDDNGKVFIADHDLRVYNITRVRRSVNANLDFKLAPGHTLFLDGNYNWRDDRENRFRLRHRYRGDREDFADDLIYDAAGNITGYKGGEVLRQTKGGIDNNRSKQTRLEDQRVRSVSLKGEHSFGLLKMNWSGLYALASEKRPNERYIALGRRSIEVSQDISDLRTPLLTDATPLTDYTRLGELTEQFQDQHEQDLTGKINFAIPVKVISNRSGEIRFGGKYRQKTKVRDNNFFSYSPLGDNEANFENITKFRLDDMTNDRFYAGDKFKAGQFISPDELGNFSFSNTSLFEATDEPAEYLAGNYEAQENITAGFVAWKQDLTSRLGMNIGLRLEHTAIDYTGNIVLDEEELGGQVTNKNSYLDILPNVNLRYSLTDNFILRAAWTNTIARPKFYDLVPYFLIIPGDQELTAGNPKLDPVKSSNIDLMAENYFESIGLVSGGVFYKKMKNFFYNYLNAAYTRENFASDFPGVNNPIEEGRWEFAQRRNGDGADVLGAELALQRQFDFLPGFWRGLGLYLNYTYTWSKAEGIYGSDGTLIRENVKLPGAAPHIFNASLSYENKAFTGRISANFTSAYVDDSDDGGYTDDAFYDRYYDKQFFLDVNASYRITPMLRIFAEANNLTNQPLRYYQGVAERTSQLEYYGPKFNLGLKFDLLK